MEITINTKGDWDAGLFEEGGAFLARSYGDDEKEEIERAMIELNIVFSRLLDELAMVDD